MQDIGRLLELGNPPAAEGAGAASMGSMGSVGLAGPIGAGLGLAMMIASSMIEASGPDAKTTAKLSAMDAITCADQYWDCEGMREAA